jgi:hypothetical protein
MTDQRALKSYCNQQRPALLQMTKDGNNKGKGRLGEVMGKVGHKERENVWSIACGEIQRQITELMASAHSLYQLFKGEFGDTQVQEGKKREAQKNKKSFEGKRQKKNMTQQVCVKPGKQAVIHYDQPTHPQVGSLRSFGQGCAYSGFEPLPIFCVEGKLKNIMKHPIYFPCVNSCVYS